MFGTADDDAAPPVASDRARLREPSRGAAVATTPASPPVVPPAVRRVRAAAATGAAECARGAMGLRHTEAAAAVALVRQA
mmetsp:Transcript_71089/g.197488  ORF Transcript_71089/g.197488 Transcript_71089/m.197488 type:complete len:80 (+) Transcript_71089:780-1019(+)